MLRNIIVPFISDPKFIHKEALRERWSPDDTKLYIDIAMRDEQNPEWSVIKGIEEREEAIDTEQANFVKFSFKLPTDFLKENEDQANRVFFYNKTMKTVERIADIIHDELIPYTKEKATLNFDFSDEGKVELMIFHGEMCVQAKWLGEIFSSHDPKMAQRNIYANKRRLDAMFKRLEKNHNRRIHEQEESAVTHPIHEKILDSFKRINQNIYEIAQ